MNHEKPVIVVGNEKGGCGKSTTAMHLIVGLAMAGLRVTSIDLDVRQSSLSRYIANRRAYCEQVGTELPSSQHYTGAEVIGEDDAAGDGNNERAAERLKLLIEGALANSDMVVVDTPGSDTELSRIAHSMADTLITPVNDSFVDLDVLGHIDARRKQVLGPSHYAEMILDMRLKREDQNLEPSAWYVLRNRIGQLDSHNARDVAWALEELSSRLSFTTVHGFSERVIFRELFLVGLTILDLREASGGKPLSSSHVAARNEVENLVKLFT
jgi:chromosome partitioning protein